MPRVLKLWAFPVPQDFEHASRIAAELLAQERPANRLFERFAAWCAAQPVEPGTWAHGIVGGRSDRPVCRLAIRDGSAPALLPEVVEAATSLGLVVLDESQGECHLPGGSLLERGGVHRIGRHFGRELAGPLTPALVERTMTDTLLMLLASEGFEESRAAGGLGRRHDGGTQWLRWRAIDAPPGRVAFDVDIVLVSDPLRKVMDSLLAIAFPGEKHGVTASGSLGTFAAFQRLDSKALVKKARQYFELGSLDELRVLAVQLRRFVADEVRPMLRRWCDLENVAWSVCETSFEAWRIVGNETTVDERGISSAVIGAHLLHVRDSGTPVTEVLLAGMAEAPVMPRVIDAVRAQIERLPEPRRTGEHRLLEETLAALRGSGLLRDAEAGAPQSAP